MNTHPSSFRTRTTMLAAVVAPVIPARLLAHCDTLDGPVVAAAKAALQKGDVTPVLRWVKPAQEREVREQFQRALRVRRQSPEAREMADLYFFETLVRLHRLGEGAPYTGIQAGSKLEPIIGWSDEALESGSAEGLSKLVTHQIASGIRQRFEEAHERKQHADESVVAGREFVASYVEYTHYVERLFRDAVGASDAHEPEEKPAEPQHQH